MPAKKKYQKVAHSCPFCDVEITEAAFPYCEACKVTVLTCPECKEPLPRDKQICPKCGTDVKKAAKKVK